MAGVEKGAGSREWSGGDACVGTGVQVLVSVALALEVVLPPVFRSWSPSCSRWNLCRGPGSRCDCVGTSVGTCVQVVVAVVVALEPVSRSGSPLCSCWN